jgi:fatty-acyl-CoA synthase
MYISGGENVYPAEVERSLSEHPSIEEVAIVSVPHKEWGEVGYAFYRGDGELKLERVRTFLNNSLCRYKHPLYIENIKDFPLLGSGKINKQSLKLEALRKV